MSNLFASIFTGFGAFFSGIFGGGHATMNTIAHPAPNSAWVASTTAMHGMGMMPMMRNGVFGIVTAIDGSTITVDGRQGTSTATTTYSVDASNAKIIKGSATGTSTASISDISVGDHVAVSGPVASDDSIVAVTIIDGRIPMTAGDMRGNMSASSTMGYYGHGIASSTMMRWNNGASSTPGMRHPTPGSPRINPGGPMQRAGDPRGINPGGPMIPAQGAVQLDGQGDNASVNAGASANIQ